MKYSRIEKTRGRKPELYVLTDEQKKLIEDNMGFLWHYYHTQIVPRYSMLSNADLEELFSVLTLSICKAAEKWEPERGKFTTCAYWYFRSGISKYFQEKQKYNFYIILAGSIESMKFIEKEPFVSWDSLVNLLNVSNLTKVEKKVMILKIQDGYCSREIGEVIGRSKQRVHQIVKTSIEKLKNFVIRNNYKMNDFFLLDN